MVQCSVDGCFNRSSRKSATQKELECHKSISFHLFPKDPLEKKQWMETISYIHSTDPHPKICSAHFEESCFIKVGNRRHLVEGSIPTIFGPSCLIAVKPQKSDHDSASPVLFAGSIMEDDIEMKFVVEDEEGEEDEEEEGEEEEDEDSPSPNMEDLSVTSSSVLMTDVPQELTPRSDSREVRQLLKDCREKYRKQIRTLQQIKRRHVKKIEQLNDELERLKGNGILPVEHKEDRVRRQTIFKITSSNTAILEKQFKEVIHKLQENTDAIIIMKVKS